MYVHIQKYVCLFYSVEHPLKGEEIKIFKTCIKKCSDGEKENIKNNILSVFYVLSKTTYTKPALSLGAF